MQTNSLFVDTSGWMAYLVASEDYHAQALQEIDAALGTPRIAIYTTDHVLAELVAVMQGRRIPRAQILRAVDGLLVAPRIVKLFTDEMLFAEAWAKHGRCSFSAPTRSGPWRTPSPSCACND